MRFACYFALACILGGSANADPAPANPAIFLDALPVRNIGPANMGGRITDIEVVESDPKTIYVAAASGGIWKTNDGGETWSPIFEHQGVASIGDIAVAPSNPNIVWVGTGEANARNSVSWGDGVYKSTDAGRTWQHMGLKETRHIGRVVIDPKNPDIVYVAALGHLWGPNKERGLYKTCDGGKTWQQIKYIDPHTGFIDVAMDPSDPDILYASTYRVRRDGFSGGNPTTQWGAGTGLFRSIDAGKTWEKMTDGLPARPLGRCGFSICRKNPNIVYAIVQTDRTALSVFGQAAKESSDADLGGVFRSEDKGKSWKKLNDLCPRPFYFGQIRADPNDDRRVYVLGIFLHISEDGGRTFPLDRVPRGIHADHHALWIDPNDSKHLISGTDGGLYVSRDGGRIWDAIRGFPIGQFYGLAVDMRTPPYVYGGLQDNGTWGGPTATFNANGITLGDWRRVAGGDGFQCAVDPTDHTRIYAEGQFGRLQRFTLGGRDGPRFIMPRPERGCAAYRFNWESPLLLSPHDPKTIYFGGNFLFKSTNRGDKWESISPDLTRGRPGLPSFGHTITTIAESPRKAGVLWVGTDDGKVQVSRDGGENWTDVSENIHCHGPAQWISCIECSHFDEGTAYVNIDRHRNDDLKPYVYKTTDFGDTWQPLAANLPAEEPVHVLIQSSRNRDLLFAGTECGLYVSLDGGKVWHRYRGLPTVSVYDLVIHPRDRDLVIGTHGRSIYVLDIAPLEELNAAVRASDLHLFAIKPAFAIEPKKIEFASSARTFRAPNPPVGCIIHYYLRAAPAKPAAISISDSTGKQVATLPGAGAAGFHRQVWNLRPAADKPLAAPGVYTVTLQVDGKKLLQKVDVKKAP